MTEPTIDEMLAYLTRDTGYYGWDQMRAAIRAILEEHRDQRKIVQTAQHVLRADIQSREIEIIRAFVARVENRAKRTGGYRAAIEDELAAMAGGKE